MEGAVVAAATEGVECKEDGLVGVVEVMVVAEVVMEAGVAEVTVEVVVVVMEVAVEATEAVEVEGVTVGVGVVAEEEVGVETIVEEEAEEAAAEVDGEVTIKIIKAVEVMDLLNSTVKHLMAMTQPAHIPIIIEVYSITLRCY